MAWLNDISERKLAERALAQREAFFSSLAELSIVGIHRADNEGNCTYVNQACCDLAGVRPEELLGNRWRQFLHPLDREQVLADWKQAAERHEKYDGVFRCVHADGHTIWVHSQSQPERAPNGNITGRVGTIMDVSRRILQEQEIRRLNRKLQEKVTELEALFHVIPIGLAIAEDAQCHVIRANRDFARVLQTPVSANVSFSGPESQRPSHFKIFSAGKEMLPREMPLQLATATGNSVRDCELQIAHEDGRSYNVLAFTTPLFDDRGVVRGAVGAFLDITERKRAEQSLAHRKRRLRDILNSMYVFVGQFATDGKVLETNKAALDVAKLSPDDVFGKYLWDTYWFSHSSTAERELKAVFQKVAGGESVRFDTMVRVGEAEFITIDATFSPLCDSQGHVVEAIGSAVDITKRLQDQQDLLRHREQLTHVLRLACLGEFATGIAHELSQPLMAISFSVQLLQVLCSEPTPNQPRIGETLDQLSSQSLRAGEILRHMRRLVRKAPNRAVPVNINSIIPAVISLAQPAARLASISLEFQPAEELPLVTVDSIQFEQVILNLLQNALEAIEAGGGKARRILITTSRHDADSICVSVADTGAGIPLSQMDSIFVAFHTTKPDGLGMGLAISRSIVEACGGQLLFDRTVHSGACFRVILPITAGISP